MEVVVTIKTDCDMAGNQCGFTLMELIVTMAVAAVLISIAVPSFSNIIFSSRLTTSANFLVGAMTQARIEAIRRNSPTQLCSNLSTTNSSDTLGAACGTVAGAVYALSSDGTSASSLQNLPALPQNITLTTLNALRYRSNGLASTPSGTAPYTGLVADLSTTRITSNNRRCLYLTTGSIVSSCTYTSTVACPTSEPTPCQP